MEEIDDAASRAIPGPPEEVARLRAEIAHLRQTAALRAELTRLGAMPEALGLLCGERLLDDEGDAAAWAASLREQYGFLFRETRSERAPAVSPPIPLERGLTPEDLRGMSPEEINSQWEEVREALAR